MSLIAGPFAFHPSDTIPDRAGLRTERMQYQRTRGTVQIFKQHLLDDILVTQIAPSIDITNLFDQRRDLSIPIDSFSNDSVFDIQAEGTPFGLNGVSGISAFAAWVSLPFTAAEQFTPVFGGRQSSDPFTAGQRLFTGQSARVHSQSSCYRSNHYTTRRPVQNSFPYRLIRLRVCQTP